jgi:2-polyprenyl-6-methoxyphenol hydroxylase-like FAD-dependent oxidoreductase
VTNRYASSLRRRYDRLRRFPAGFVVIGDAMCSFNPLYGQGMSITALQATALRNCLRTGDADLARRFFRATARPIELAWRMGYGNDIAVTSSDGPPPPRSIRITNALADRLLAATTVDAVVTERFLEVSGFLRPPTALLRPGMIARVLAANVRLARRGRRDRPSAKLDRDAGRTTT